MLKLYLNSLKTEGVNSIQAIVDGRPDEQIDGRTSDDSLLLFEKIAAAQSISHVIG